VEEDAKFRADVREGIAAADRGEFVEHEEVWANVEKILQS
jgi:predicted transcriptional regulator